MKKALTPIVSTIVLLGFAIGLGSLVMSWGNSEALLRNCADVDLGITYLDGEEQLCLDGNNINVILENNGITDISKLKIVALSETEVYTDEFEVSISPGQFEKKSFDLDAGGEKILKIRFIPYIEKVHCTEKRVEVENIKGCK